MYHVKSQAPEYPLTFVLQEGDAEVAWVTCEDARPESIACGMEFLVWHAIKHESQKATSCEG